MKKTFYKIVTIAFLVATFMLARHELKVRGTISGLTLLPFVLLLIPYFCEEVAKMIKSVWQEAEEADENEEA